VHVSDRPLRIAFWVLLPTVILVGGLAVYTDSWQVGVIAFLIALVWLEVEGIRMKRELRKKY
jgi:hypothetical protein